MSGVSCRAPLECTGLNVVIADSSMNNFVSKADVKAFLDREYGTYIGQPLDSIDLVKVEKIIDGRSAVHKSQAYMTRDGRLNIRVTQRRPMVRFQKKDGGFYADAEGFVFPLQSSYASYVQIVDGDIPINMKSGHKGMIENPKEKEWFDKVMNVVNFIEGSKVWKDRIVQIHVDNGGELILIPREGKERFNIGQPVNIKDKFDRMATYYTAIAANREGQAYRTVTLKYDGQIVCR
jgi:cell division protein FtsQ